MRLFLKFILALTPAAFCHAASVPIQLTGLDGGFTAGCVPEGCGGKFDATIGGTPSPDGILTGGTSIFVFCVDFQNSVYIPSAIYQANVSTVVDGSDLSNTRYGRTSSQWDGPEDPSEPVAFRNASFEISPSESFTPPTALQRYQMAAWLVNEYSVLGSSDRDAIQEAIWHIMDVVPPADETGPDDYSPPPYPGAHTATGTEIRSLISQAADFVANHYSGSFFSQFEIISNVGPIYLEGQNPAQEFISMIPATPAPEPSTFAVVIAGIFGALGWFRFRGRRNRETPGKIEAARNV